MPEASSTRRGPKVSGALLATALVLACLQFVGGWHVPAAAVPAITVAADVPANTLIGRETPVGLTFRNPGTDPAYNLGFFIRLPLGVSVSSSDEPPTSVTTETDAGGNPISTVVAWENVVDIVPSSYFEFRVGLAHDVGTGPNQWEVGETFTPEIHAFVNDVNSVVPQIEPVVNGQQVTVEANQYTRTGSAAEPTTLVPLLLTKSEPSIEGELLRGVHDHQTTYTLTVETGSVGSGVTVGPVEDWIPAGLEFLGCGDEDNSLTEEYPGSGPLNPGNAPALPYPCREPDLVETVDSGLPPGLSGVFTHVVWEVTSSVPPDTVISFSYVAGIPQRENTTTWPHGQPTAASGNQASNLDNNTGGPTTQVGDGTTYTNLITVDTTFEGTDTTVEATETVQAVDLSVHKFVDSPAVEQGAISTWQLYLETSEYVVADGIHGLRLVDVAPDGTCPIGSENPRCTVTEPHPVPPFTSTSYPAPGPGQTTLEWVQTTEVIGPSEVRIVSFSTEALESYANGAPVSANDSWTNQVDLTADVTTFGPDGPDEPDGFETNPVTDDSSASQSGSAVSFRKDVGRPADGQQCGDGTDVDWSPDSITGTGPGDRVCFRLTADPPESLDTIDGSMTDFLPPGLRYEEGSTRPGPDNEVPPALVIPTQVSGTPATGQRLDWVVRPQASVEPGQTAQLVFSAVLDGGVPPDLIVSGESLVNDARVTYENSNGEIFVVRDDAEVGLTEAHLDLVKGISATSPPTTTYDPPLDTVTNVVGGTAVTYSVRVTNDGTSDAVDTEVRDLLAVNDQSIADTDATCAQVSAISDGGTCTGDDIVWDGLTVPAGETIELTYTWTMPSPLPVSASWTNEAGVVEYHSTTNTGADFEYVPRDNIVPGRNPDANTDPARDDAHVSSPGISLTKTRTTSILEPGNARANQATIGEVISYTVEGRQSAGTTATDYVLTDDLAARGLRLLPGTVQVRTATVAPGTPCAYADPPITPTPGGPLTVTGELITFSLDTVDVGAEDGCAALTFDAVVQDVPGAGDPLNVRSGNVRNQAQLSFVIGGTVARTLTARVDTQIVEPNIRIDKNALSTGVVLPGNEVAYELKVTNLTGAQVSTAHGLQVVDDFSGSDVADVIANPDGGTVAGNTITWTLPADPDGNGQPGLAPGASFTLHYTVRLADNLEAGATLENTARVTTSSLLGDSDDERSPASPCSPAACPGYVHTDSASLTVAGPSIVKTVTERLHTVGDEAVYVATLFFPAHLDFGPETVTLSDDLAGAATTFLRTVNAVCVGCTDGERAQYRAPEDNGTAATDTPRWDLAVFDAADVPRRVVITYAVRVEDADDLGAGDTLTNTATLDYVNDTLQDDAEIEIAEPDVSLVKRVGSSVATPPRVTTPGDPVPAVVGGTVTYELEVTNTGGWTAYDVVVTDEPDSVSSGGSCTGDARLEATGVADGPGWLVTDGTLGTGDACLRFRVPALLPDQSITITYTLTVPEDFPRSELIEGPEFVNQAAVPEYFALVAADRVDNPDVRPYPTQPPTATGYVNLGGAALGDLVWLDQDADGLGPDTGDTGEPGIEGVTVTVTGPGGTLTRETDADGRWLTDDGRLPPDWLVAGDYTVTVDQDTLPPGLVNTFDPDGGLDSTAETTLAENEVDLDQDFGYAGDQSVGDTVWLDRNADGDQDAGEPGIPGVAVSLTWAGVDEEFGTDDDVDYGTISTDDAGQYTFTLVPAGPVRVSVDPDTLPAGLEPTFDLDGGLDHTADRTVAAGEDATDVDFGYTGTARVGDRVWWDLDADGFQDPGEPGIPGIGLTVVWAGFDGDFGTDDDLTYTRTTDGDGGYLVDHLPAGQVRVSVDTGSLPPGVEQTFDADGTLDHETVRVLTDGLDDREADFGYVGSHVIGDLVWLDVDADGLGPDTGDAGEPGVPGQRVETTWAGADGELGTDDDVDLLVAITSAAGRWTVTGVPDGLVRVRLVGQPATTLTVTADPDATLDGSTQRTITEDALDLDFGLAGTASVGDLVWVDLDADGAVQAGEPPIPGVALGATWAGFDGNLGTSDDVDYGRVTTGADGLYVVRHLPPGPVRVAVDTSTVPAGLVPTYDLDGGLDQTTVRSLNQGEDARDVDFGYRGTGQAGDFVWWDLDSDGVQDPGEPGLPGIPLTLVWAGLDGAFGTTDDGRLDTDTDAEGGYLFSGLPVGDFRVSVATDALPAGMAATFDVDGTLDSVSAFALTAGASDLTLDFGYAGGLSLGDLVWRDVNQDEKRQRDEPALGGVDLTVRYLGADGVEGGDDDLVLETSTTKNGGPLTARQGRAKFTGGVPQPGEPFYLVPGLVPGTYLVDLDPETLPGGLSPLSDRDGGDPTHTRVPLAGAPVLDADFGAFRNNGPQVEDLDAVVARCDVAVAIDPLEGVTDPNGDELSLVPGSVQVPEGVTFTVTDAGDLLVRTSRDVTISWQVTDGQDGTITVTRDIEVTGECGSLPGAGSDLPRWWPILGIGLVLAGLALYLTGRRRRDGSSLG